MKFRTHLLILVMAVAVPLLILSAAVTAWTAVMARRAVLQGMSGTSQALQLAIDRELRTTLAAIEALATSPAIDQALAAGPNGGQDQLAPARSQSLALMTRRPAALHSVVLLDHDGRQVFNTLASLGQKLPNAASPPLPRGIALGLDVPALMAELVKTRRPHVSNLFWGPVAERYLIAVQVPVIRNDQVVGIMGANLLPSSLQEVLHDLSRPAGWVASLIDANGIVIARSTSGSQFLGQPAAPAIQSFLADANKDWPKGVQQQAIIETQLLDGTPSYGSLQRLASASWVVGYGAPRALVNAPIWQSLTTVAVGGSLAMLCVVIATSIIGRRLGQEVASLARPAAALAQGMQVGMPLETAEQPLTRVREVAMVRKSLAAAADVLEARETALQILNDSLETRVRAAVEERENARAQLFQAQKMEAIGQLTGGIAHDFNNLLAAVLGSLELLRKRIPDTDARALRLLENARQGGLRGAALTQRLLAFGRRQTLSPEAVQLPKLLQNMSALLRSSLGTSIEVSTNFPPDLPAAHVDANQLELALLNLALNARDAMNESGRITITARLAATGSQASDTALRHGAIVVSVTDTGTGMDEATLARAVEPFFTTKDVGKGTGLGLSMVHGLAAQSGGRLVLRSQPGQGTTAELWLPCAETAPASAPNIPASAHNAPSGPKRQVILIVDDDPLVLASTGSMLDDLGFIVREATCGLQALEIMQAAADVNVVVTDQSMPGMTGVQLAAELHRSRPNLPVVLATGYGDLVEVARAGIPVLRKPFNQALLAQMIARCLDAPERRKAAL